jgi:Tfp pilus assembly protein PilF
MQPRRAAQRLTALVLAGILAFTGCSSGKDKGSSSGPPAAEIAQLLQAGVAAQQRGDLSTAQQKYEQVVVLDPTNKVAHYDLGVIYQQLRSNDQAAAEYARAIAIDKAYASALFNFAILETSRNPQHAVALYRQILVTRPKDANVHFNLGLLLKHLGHTAQGQAELDTALALAPALRSRLPKSPSPSPSAGSTTS